MIRLTMLRPLTVLMAALAVTLSGCGGNGGGDAGTGDGQRSSLTIGAFNFTESQILAEVYAEALRAEGYAVTIIKSTNREVLQPALESGEVDMVPEYLGTFTEFLNAKVNGPDAASASPVASGDVEQTLAGGRELADPLGITLLEPSPAADQNAFAVTRAFAEEHSLTTLSDLAALSRNLDITLGGPPECPQRPFCQPGLESTYEMRVARFVPLDAGGPLTKQALSQGRIDVGLVFSSDGAVADLDLVVLEDDRSLQQVDNIVPAVRSSVLTDDIARILNAVSSGMTTDDLIDMNKQVDIDRKAVREVAVAFLRERDLIDQ
jgi:osmoprotectant transport system substrate-binding protein